MQCFPVNYNEYAKIGMETCQGVSAVWPKNFYFRFLSDLQQAVIKWSLTVHSQIKCNPLFRVIYKPL